MTAHTNATRLARMQRANAAMEIGDANTGQRKSARPRLLTRSSRICFVPSSICISRMCLPKSAVAFAGLLNKVKSAKLLATGQSVTFSQDGYRVRFTGLPAIAPDTPITTIAVECEGEPKQDQLYVRRRERAQV